MPTHRASLGNHSHRPTKNIVEGIAVSHPSNVQHLVAKLSRNSHLRPPCTTHLRRWIIPEGRRIDTKLSHYLMPVQKAARSTCSVAVLCIQGFLPKTGASVRLVLGVSCFSYRNWLHRSFHSHDSPSQKPLHLHISPPQSRSSVGNTHDGTGYLKAGPSTPSTSRLKRARSQEESFAYDHNPSGDDYDQHKEDANRVKS